VHGVGADHTKMMVECFPGIRSEHLHKAIGNRDMDSTETLIIHVGTSDLRSSVDLNWVTGKVYALVTTVRVKHPNCRLVLSGVLGHSYIMET
jgi:hypothetical protein